MGHERTLAYEPWPAYDESALIEKTQEIPVQINGKVRSKVIVPANAPQEDVESAALSDGRIAELLAEKQIRKTIVVPGKLINFVVG